MPTKDIDWGFPYKGKIYVHLDKEPDPKVEKWVPRSELYPLGMEMPRIRVNFVYDWVITNPAWHLKNIYAIPLLEWERIR
jgi:hypothetical protein